MLHRLVIGLAVSAAMIAPAQAQGVVLTLNDHEVTLVVTSVSRRKVLEEWARTGGIRIQGLEKVPDEAVSLSVRDVPEVDLLAQILEPVVGFIAVPRAIPEEGRSAFGSLLIFGRDERPSSVPPEAFPLPVNLAPADDDVVPEPATGQAAPNMGEEVWPIPANDNPVTDDAPPSVEPPVPEWMWPIPTNPYPDDTSPTPQTPAPEDAQPWWQLMGFPPPGL